MTMVNMEMKARREREVFREFLRQREWPLGAGTAESRKPPEPDILWRKDDGAIAFELVEICDSTIAKTISDMRKVGEQVRFLRCEDPTPKIREKLGKEYRNEHPIELLCYTDGRTVSPNSQILAELELVLAAGLGPFRRVWLLGDKCHLVASNGSELG